MMSFSPTSTVAKSGRWLTARGSWWLMTSRTRAPATAI